MSHSGIATSWPLGGQLSTANDLLTSGAHNANNHNDYDNGDPLSLMGKLKISQ